MNTNDYQVGGTHYTSLHQQPFTLIKKTSANFSISLLLTFSASMTSQLDCLLMPQTSGKT